MSVTESVSAPLYKNCGLLWYNKCKIGEGIVIYDTPQCHYINGSHTHCGIYIYIY